MYRPLKTCDILSQGDIITQEKENKNEKKYTLAQHAAQLFLGVGVFVHLVCTATGIQQPRNPAVSFNSDDYRRSRVIA